MKHFKIALLLMMVLGLAGFTVSLSFAEGDLGHNSNKAGPTISFHSTGWDATKSFYQVAGTATFSGGGIDRVEYFINDGDTPGTGLSIAGGSGLSPLMFTFSVPENAMKSGDNTICVHALSSTSLWGTPTCLTATK